MRKLTLTADHVARVHKVVDDQRLAPGAELHTDADYDGWVERMIRSVNMLRGGRRGVRAS